MINLNIDIDKNELEKTEQLKNCIPKPNNYIILHGSFGSKDGNWFPWLKKQLENKKYKVGLDSWFESYYYPNEILVYSEDTGKLYKGTRSNISAKTVIPTTFLETTDADAL